MAKWVMSAKKADFNGLAEKLNVDPVIVRIMRNRELLTYEDMYKFLNGSENDMHSPYLLNDMEEAVKILLNAVSENKKIRVIGDYDVDGVTSTYILTKGIRELGGNVDYSIPNRITDGYGINEGLIEKASADGVELIVTCDNGIAAKKTFELANSKGITSIITDHHEVPYEEVNGEITYIYPDVAAIINPKRHDSTYPFKGICGAMVAYKLICAAYEKREASKEILKELREMAGFGTICDVMELVDENRILLKLALKDMENSHNIGIRALRKVCNLDKRPMTGYQLGFVMGPCINATGRLDSASLSLELLFSDTMEDAIIRATELKRLNDLRKEMTEEGVRNAFEIISENGLDKNRVMVVYLPELHESLAGIVAGRIRERFYRPTIVITKTEEGLKGSGRSIEAYNMHEELNKVSELFTKFGGHKMAAGLSLEEENLNELTVRLNENCKLTEADLSEKFVIDVPMPLNYVSEKLINNLEILEPFGPGNQKPVFAIKNVHFISFTSMGKSGDMGKFKVITEDGQNKELILFRGLDEFAKAVCDKYGGGAWDKLVNGNGRDAEIVMDVIYYPGINEFRGNRSIQFVMQNYK